MEGRFIPTLEKAHPAPPRRARSLPPRSVPLCAGAGKGITSSFATGLGPAALHASGRLSLCFGPGGWAGSDRFAGKVEPGAMGVVTHRREWSLWPHVRDSLTDARGCEC